ncbi:MAG: ABC transporter ATP-binding protein [Deltaproteobacteria bacterium]|nr:MAG: ABC transporter ATP-binding protein [Deltaproteobacteria bacterium]
MLSVKDLCKAFGGVQANSYVNYEMISGELSAIIGPNGAGKSTFFNLLTGYHLVDSGKVYFKGRDITNWAPHRITRLGISRAFQVSNIYPRLTTYENVRQAILAQQRRTLNLFVPANQLARQDTFELLEVAGLSQHADMLAGNLSQGDKKRLELAIALGSRPELLFLDEPTAGMSGEETHDTMELVARLNQEMGLTILFTEHDMSVVFGYARRLTVLHLGSVIAEGTPEDVRTNDEVQRVYLGEEA